MFSEVCLSTHVTTVKVIDPFLLEGCGYLLNLYSLHSRLLVQSLSCLKGTVIHGICSPASSDARLAVHGSKQFTVLQISSHDSASSPLTPCSNLLHENDWIWDLAFLDYEDEIGLLLAHNIFSVWNWNRGEKLYSVACEEKCILYCGSIIGTTWETLAILSGTVFQEIVVWKPDKEAYASPVLDRLEGHQGVIFSVQYLPELKVILSTSDDRSVRTWAVRFHGPTNTFDNCSVEPRLCLFGHSARVIQALGFPSPKPDRPAYCSLGEDSCVALWTVEGQIVAKWRAHGGAAIWAAALQNQTLITGGGDGAIKCWNLEHNLSVVPRTLPFSDVGNYPRLVALSGSGSVYLLTLQGDLAVWLRDWVVVASSSLFVNASSLMFNTDRTILALGTLKGSVALYDTSVGSGTKLVIEEVCEGKLLALLWLSASAFLVSGPQGEMRVWEWNGTALRKLYGGSFILPVCKQRWAASALLHKERLLVGDRDGNLHIYNLCSQECTPWQKPVRSLLHFHGQEGITSLSAWPAYILSTGKDGSVKVCGDFGKDCSDEACIIREDVTHLGWTSSALAWQGETLITGFSSSNFVLWSCAQQRDLLQIPCGGGHRSWDFLIGPNSEASFVFIKDKKVSVHRAQLQSVAATTFKLGLHSRAIQSCTTLATLGETVLVTGGEDTEVRLHYLQDDSLKFLATIRSHISSVRTLAACPLSSRIGGDDFLLVSGGGRAQLVATKLQFATSKEDGTGLGVNCHHLTSHFLRGNSKVSPKKPWLDPELVPDPETRYMDLTLWHYQDSLFRLAVAGSDGGLRLFNLDYLQRQFTVEATVTQSHCLLRTRLLASPRFAPRLVTGGTDGQVTFWDAERLVAEQKLACHQSGINALDILWLTDSKFLLATGGDDNALRCSLVGPRESDYRLLSNHTVAHAHAAQISGVRFVRDTHLLTASVDQRVVLWEVVLKDENAIALVWRKAWLSPVADIQGLHVYRMFDETAAGLRNEWHACVFGQGLEILRVNSTQVPDADN